MFYYPRLIDTDLKTWATTPDRKPLVLRGARQTGKTETIRQLGKNFNLFVELNLEKHQDRKLVEGCSSAEELLQALALRHNLVGFPDRTLLFFDEIQEHARTVGWLRFLYEDHPEIHIVAAGSLMEVRLRERGFSFPVGRVTFRYLHPFSFQEFLVATGRDVLAAMLRESAAALEAPTVSVHQQAQAAFFEYVLVGGMPEAVRRWVEQRSPVGVRQAHVDLFQSLSEDLQKYQGVRDLSHLEAAFDNLGQHYGQRFKYESFAPGFRSHQMKISIDRLEGAMICRRVWPTSDLHPPLSIKPRSAPKLLPLDVGLANSIAGIPVQTLLSSPVERVLQGRVAESVVGQLLLSADTRTNANLHFWVRESSRSNAEVDYLVSTPSRLVPVEVKAGAAGTLKSLHQYLQRSGTALGLRLYGGPWTDEQQTVNMPDGTLTYRLLSLPVFMAEVIPDLQLGPVA